VWTMVWQADQQVWKVWTPAAGPVDTLTKIVDGQGYWIKMKANDSLTIHGTWGYWWWRSPEYPVYDGWNLIGYTHWGRPTICSTDEVQDYLVDYLGAGRIIDWGPPCLLTAGLLFDYDPSTNVWKQMDAWEKMVLGKGYWLWWFIEAGGICF
jgi:hypothetical protein